MTTVGWVIYYTPILMAGTTWTKGVYGTRGEPGKKSDLPSASLPTARGCSAFSGISACIFCTFSEMHVTVVNVFERKNGQIHQSRQRVVRGDQRKLQRLAQRPQVRPQIQATAKHFLKRGRNIRAHADPTDARRRLLLGHWQTLHHFPKQIGKIHSSATAQW